MTRVTYWSGRRLFIATFLPEFIEVPGPEAGAIRYNARKFSRSFFTMAGSSRFAVGATLTALACTFVVFSLGAQQQTQQPPQSQQPQQQQPAPAGGRQSGPPREGQPPGGRGDQPAAPQQKPVVPVATNSVNAHPDRYLGQTVTMTAAVDQVLSKSAFSVDQQRVAGAPAPKGPTDVLVLVPTLQSPVDPKSYVTVMGELVTFDPAEVAKKAKDYKLDLPSDVAAKYNGRPALIATSVIDRKRGV